MAIPSQEKLKIEKEEEESREEKKEEEDEEVDDDDDEAAVKWVKHYSSMHHILLVGEGDFSFSLCLANAFGSASNIVATSLDSHDTVLKKYNRAKSNLERLKEIGATILHEIDATKMKLHTDLKMRKFDRIIFNFPHAGFKGKEDNMRLINLHRQIVNGFFNNASHMLRPYGEVHVNHKIGKPFHRWNLKELGSWNSLTLTDCVDFCIEDYPGYNNKRGDGARSDQPFPLGECRTFKFRIGDIRRRKKAKESMPDFVCGRSFTTETVVANPSPFERYSSTHLPPAIYPHEVLGRTNFPYDMEGIQSSLHHPPMTGISNAYFREPGRYGFGLDSPPMFHNIKDPVRNSDVVGIQSSLHHPPMTGISNAYFREPGGYGFRLDAPPTFHNIEDPMRNSYQPYMNEVQRDPAFSYLDHLEEIRCQSVSRQERLQDLMLKYGRG